MARHKRDQIASQVRFQRELKKQQLNSPIEDEVDDQDLEDENKEEDLTTKWYLIDQDKPFCQCWDFIISMLLIYEQFVVPYLCIFNDVYMKPDPNDPEHFVTFDKSSRTLHRIELIIDIIFCVEIVLNFLKKSLAATKFKEIASRYIFSYFLFDLVPTVVCLVYNESVKVYGFKLLRLVHVHR